jgi:hypothetical protein
MWCEAGRAIVVEWMIANTSFRTWISQIVGNVNVNIFCFIIRLLTFVTVS